MSEDSAAGSIYVAGHTGLVGSAICRKLRQSGTKPLVANSCELDLVDQGAVREWFQANDVSSVYLAAAIVGGIAANDARPADFLYSNLMIQSNVIHEAWASGVSKLLFLGSSCIYPRNAEQPIREDSLLNGPLESTNEAYAIAKIAGLKMCQAYRKQHGFDAISAMPTNLYGPGDNFDLESSHVVPALIRKFHEAKTQGARSVSIWGSGKPRREFMYVDDLADACIFLMANYSGEEIVNIGWGKDLTVAELALRIKEIVGFHGDVSYDTSRPDGTPRKLLDVSRLTALGWSPSTSLELGLRDTYKWYRSNERSDTKQP